MSTTEIDLEVDAVKLADEIRKAGQESITEEDLKIRVENTLRKILDPLGFPWARYERTTVVSGSRSDALYGNVILEYERPTTFNTASGFEGAIEQLKGYITEDGNAVRRFIFFNITDFS